MTDTNEPASANPASPLKSEPSLDSAPLELTVTTSITSLTPVSSSAESIASTSPSSTPAAAPTSEECSTMDVGAMEETGLVSPKLETEHDSDCHDSFGHYPQSKSSASRRVSPIDAVLVSDTEIKAGARFSSFADFERVFNVWKTNNYHPFRVASSETLRLPDGSTNATFKYRYIVYHCAHYGAPRRRGVGKRPNQNYMPCGCKAMLRLNYSWSENALRVTTLNEEHFGHDATEDAYYKFAAKAKQRQSSSSPPAVNGAALPPPNRLLVLKRHRSESPYSSGALNHNSPQPPLTKMMKNGHPTQAEAPLNLSKNGFAIGNALPPRGSHEHSPVVPSTKAAAAPMTPSTPALSVLMFNHQQQQQAQQQQQHAYQELIRLLSVNGNGGAGLVTALGASGVRDCRTESDRHRLIYPIMQTLTQQLASARGFEFDEKLRDLKAVLKKWQLISSQTAHIATTSPNFVNRSSSAAAAAAVMMVQAMSAGAGNGFAVNGSVSPTNPGSGGNGLISNAH